MGSFLRDIRFALRALGRERGFTAVALATFALAIASMTALFSVVDEVMFRPLPFPDEHQIVRLQNADVTTDGERVRFNMRGTQVELLASQSRVFAGVVGLEGYSGILRGSGDPQRVSIVAVSPGWAETLGVGPELGRFFITGEYAGGGAGRPAIVSHALWMQRFGGRGDLLGSTIAIDDARHEVVGVLPAGFHFPYAADVWVPVAAPRLQSAAVFARMRPGLSIEQVRAAVAATRAAHRVLVPEMSARAGLDVTRARDTFVGDEARVALALLGLTSAFLLIGVGNLGNLLLARGLARRRDTAVRAALGATAWHQFRHALAETLVLTAGGAGLGLALASWLAVPLRALVPDNFVRELNVGGGGIDARVLAFTATLALVIGAVTAAIPTWKARHAEPRDALGDGARGLSANAGRVRLTLAGGGIALSLAVMASAVVLGAHLAALEGTPLGLDRDGVLTLQVQLPSGPRGADARVRFLEESTSALSALPGVAHAGFISANPLAGGTWTVPIAAEGQDAASSPDLHLVVNHRLVTGGALDALGIRVLQGRGFDRRDAATAPQVALVSRALAQRLWPHGSALGRRVRVAVEGAGWMEVVGITSDVRDAGDVHLTWYLPYAQHPQSAAAEVLYAMVCGRDGRTPDLAAVAGAIHRVAPAAAVYDAMPLASVFDETIARDRLGARIAGALGVLGLFIATLGLYGIVSYLVSERTLEFAIRVALGATERSVLTLLVRHVGGLVLAGITAGWIGAVVLVRLAGTQIPDLGTGSAATYLLPTTVVLVASATAVWAGMRRLQVTSLSEGLRRS